MYIQLKMQFDEFDGENYVDVSGVNPSDLPSTPEVNNSYVLEFTSWPKWLGMQVDKEAFEQFTEPGILTHILFEMTFPGFDGKKFKRKKKNWIDELRKLKI